MCNAYFHSKQAGGHTTKHDKLYNFTCVTSMCTIILNTPHKNK